MRWLIPFTAGLFVVPLLYSVIGRDARNHVDTLAVRLRAPFQNGLLGNSNASSDSGSRLQAPKGVDASPNQAQPHVEGSGAPGIQADNPERGIRLEEVPHPHKSHPRPSFGDLNAQSEDRTASIPIPNSRHPTDVGHTNPGESAPPLPEPGDQPFKEGDAGVPGLKSPPKHESASLHPSLAAGQTPQKANTQQRTAAGVPGGPPNSPSTVHPGSTDTYHSSDEGRLRVLHQIPETPRHVPKDQQMQGEDAEKRSGLKPLVAPPLAIERHLPRFNRHKIKEITPRQNRPTDDFRSQANRYASKPKQQGRQSLGKSANFEHSYLAGAYRMRRNRWKMNSSTHKRMSNDIFVPERYDVHGRDFYYIPQRYEDAGRYRFRERTHTPDCDAVYVPYGYTWVLAEPFCH